MIGRLGGIRVHPVSVVLATALAGLALVVVGAGALVPIGAILAASGALTSAVWADRAARRRRVDRARLKGAGIRRAVDRAPTVSVVVPAMNEAENLPHVLPRSRRAARGHPRRRRLDRRHGRGRARACARTSGSSAARPRQGRRARGRLRGGTRRHHRDARRRRLGRSRGDPAVRRRASSAAPTSPRARASSSGGGSADITALRQARQLRVLSGIVNLALRDRLHGPLLRLQRLLASAACRSSRVDVAGFEVETLINMRVAKAGLEVAEVPSFEAERIHGESNLNTFRDGFRVLRDDRSASCRLTGARAPSSRRARRA